MLGRCARYRSERSGAFDAIVDVLGRRVVLVVRRTSKFSLLCARVKPSRNSGVRSGRASPLRGLPQHGASPWVQPAARRPSSTIEISHKYQRRHIAMVMGLFLGYCYEHGGV
jgi:hypothetical protein